MSKLVMPLTMKQIHVNFIYLLSIMCSSDDVSKKQTIETQKHLE
jgi:hypothetical protein